MFWLARLMRLERPMPPTPTPAMLRVSLGGTKPWPRTWRGTMENAAAVRVESARNLRRDMELFRDICNPPDSSEMSYKVRAFQTVTYTAKDTGKIENMKKLILALLISQTALAQQPGEKKAEQGERHDFVIANFKTESGVTLPQ